MSERRYKLPMGYTLEVNEEKLTAVSEAGTRIPARADEIIDQVFLLLDQTKSERDRLRKELEEARKQSAKWEKAFDNADKQYLKKEQEAAALRRRLNTTEYGLNCITMGEWECTHDHQGLEVWTTRRINPGQIAREALALGQEGEGNQ